MKSNTVGPEVHRFSIQLLLFGNVTIGTREEVWILLLLLLWVGATAYNKY